MTGTSDRHAPRPEFRAGLEHEVARALRRERRLATIRPAHRRFFSAAFGRLAAALAIGLFAGAAPAQVQEAQQRRTLLEAAKAEERLAILRMTAMDEELATGRRQVEMGMLSRESLAALEASRLAAQSRLQAAQLNIQEITATAAPPRNDLAAPLVGRRDFVRERLVLELGVADQELLVARQRMDQTARRHQVGVVTELELQAAHVAAEQARLRLEFLSHRVTLRNRFLREGLAPADLEHQAQLFEYHNRLDEARALLALATKRLDRVTQLHATGMSTRADLLRAELDKVEREMEISRLVREIEVLERLDSRTRR